MSRLDKRLSWPIVVLVAVALLTVATGVASAAKSGPDKTTTTTQPADPGPTDMMSDTGILFGDLYVLLRYLGGDGGVGGEPILSVEPGWTVVEIGEDDNGIIYEVQLASVDGEYVVSECLQPVADYQRWGDIWHPEGDVPNSVAKHQVVESGEYLWVPVNDISSGDYTSTYETSLDKNRIPLVLTYDATWGRTDAAVGLLWSAPTYNDDGTLNLDGKIDPYFIQPGGAWTDPVNGEVTYPDGVLWTDLLQEVSFGRIDVSRSPEAVLQSAFDEVVDSINSPDTIAIEIDSAGRLLLTKNVYDEYQVDPDTGEPTLLGTVKKAIDSPLENLALYVKLLNDGHLVTPGTEREPIDNSLSGGIPIWKEIGLEDGPSAALRPTIDIEKMKDWGLGNLVDVAAVEYYYAYYTEVSVATTTHKGKPNQDPVEVPVYKVVEVQDPSQPPPEDYPEGEDPVVWEGLAADDGGSPFGANFGFAASFLAAALDKTSDASVDLIVYLNSILGINQVVGDYAEDPVYFDFLDVTGYNRAGTLGARGEVSTMGGNDAASTYTGNVWVLQQIEEGTWTETTVPLAGGLSPIVYDNIDLDRGTHFPNGGPGVGDILGFTQMADDDLSVIKFIHTYQIPELR